jgi:dihydrofolate reductase
MSKLIVSEWVSLDGIFDAGSFDQWFSPYHSDSRGSYIQQVINSCDIMLYGRKTYEMLYPYWSSFKNNEMGVADKLNSAKKYLVSSTAKQAPWENTTTISKAVLETIAAVKNEEPGNILVQGSGELVRALLAAGLVDELKLLVNPHISGSGARLFENASSAGLKLISLQQLDNGVIALSYERA